MNAKNVWKFITTPWGRFLGFDKLGLFRNMPDEEYVKKRFKAFFGYELDLENPRTLCEKINWLKLYYRKPEFARMADKYEAKGYVMEKIGNRRGAEHIIPCLGVWNHVADIDFSALHEPFILKATHNSGHFVVCKDKKTLDMRTLNERLEKSLSENYYLRNREWVYKHVKPRIIAEPLIESLGKPDSVEYKTTCFNGKVAFVTICTGITHASFDERFNDHFDRDFEKLDWYAYYKPSPVTPKKPAQWDEIIAFSEKLAEGIPYLRVDSYVVDGQLLFGEMTFYTWGGLMRIQPPEWDLKLGEMLKLPEKRLSD